MRYRDDPYWLTAKFGECRDCGAPLKGKRAFFYPREKLAWCEKCGEEVAARFAADCFDEAALSGRW